MARFVAYDRFILSDIDLNFYEREFFEAIFADDANTSFGGKTYPDAYVINGYDGVTDLNLAFFGSNFVIDSEGVVSGGIVAAVAEAEFEGYILWAADGLSISATALYQAGLTASNADELTLVQAAFNGNDTIVLSYRDDEMNGFGGNDEITGGGGDDFIDGGAGSDTAIYAGNFGDAIISKKGASVYVTLPGEGTDILTNVEFLRFGTQTRSVATLAEVTPLVAPPAADEWTLYTGNGFVGEIAGNGKVNGSTGFQDISILSGPSSIVFDGTFNKGGDIIRVDGAASAWTISTAASTAILWDGDTYLSIPLGSAGIAVEFDDGVRSLRYDLAAQTAKIGSQAFGVGQVTVTAPPDASTLPSGADENASSRLYMASGGLALIGGDVEVFGTSAGQEVVGVVSGQVVFDGTFNKGGDTIALAEPIAAFTGQGINSRVIFKGDDIEVNIPFGTAGTTVLFSDVGGTLFYDTTTKQALIGDFIIGPEAAPLTVG